MKTHVFVSAKDFSLLRDYFKALLNEANAKPEDFQEECNQIVKLQEESTKDKSINFSQKFREIAKGNHLICEVLLYREAIIYGNKCPNGRWFSKKEAQHKQIHLQEAKEYFARKKKFNS